MRPKAWFLTLGALVMAASLPFSHAETAAQAAPPDTTPAAAPEAAPAARPGKVVKVVRIGQEAPAMRDLVMVRDAETGEMRAPTAAEWSKLAVSVDPLFRSDIGLEEMHFEDGTVGVRLGDRYQSMMLTQRSADGQLTPTCTHDAQTAVDVLEGKKVASKVEEVRDDQ